MPFNFLPKHSSPFRQVSVVAAIIGILTVTGYVDYLFGYRMSLDAFYLVPVFLAAWILGWPLSIVVSALSAVLPIAGDVLAGQRDNSFATSSWNAGVIFVLYLVFVYLVRHIKALQSSLEKQVIARTSELTAEIAAREHLEQELLTVSEQERRRLGEDVHDILCQHLTACALSAEVLREKVASGAAAVGDAATVVKLTEDGIAIARDIARGLLAIPLGEEGLNIAIEELAKKTSQQFKVECEFEAENDFPLLDAERSVQVYRIVAESVSNAIWHGKAKRIVVRAWTERAMAHISIQNDGTPFNPVSSKTGGLGIRIMKQRALLLDGSLEISSIAEGVVVHCSFPL